MKKPILKRIKKLSKDLSHKLLKELLSGEDFILAFMIKTKKLFRCPWIRLLKKLAFLTKHQMIIHYKFDMENDMDSTSRKIAMRALVN
ncbi:unnamed protein product [Paramecium sonneborni]|uniref:Uncharacterized protein n=1 Tax=Paramecium sonneborni TaxID=65129 RepID=A0A8S1RCH0_9CILI|nr:unnamed protein product [Paramecium sonneborni]